MSIMTNVKETKTYDRYTELSFAEFLEFFARLANKRLPDEGVSLAQKIEVFMD